MNSSLRRAVISSEKLDSRFSSATSLSVGPAPSTSSSLIWTQGYTDVRQCRTGKFKSARGKSKVVGRHRERQKIRRSPVPTRLDGDADRYRHRREGTKSLASSFPIFRRRPMHHMRSFRPDVFSTGGRGGHARDVLRMQRPTIALNQSEPGLPGGQ